MEPRREFRAKYSGPLLGPALRPGKKAAETPSLSIAPRAELPASEEKSEASVDSVPPSKKHTEMILICCAIVLLLVNVAGTWVAFREANAAKDTANDTNRLARLLLRGTSAAHVVANVVSQAIGPNNRQIRVSFRNDGKVNALNVQGSATVCLVSLPAGTKLACKTLPISKSQLGYSGDEITLGFDGIVGDGDITLLENNRATVEYASTFRFNDGFDDWIDSSSCQLYFVRHSLSTDNVLERNWAGCDTARTILATEARRRLE